MRILSRIHHGYFVINLSRLVLIGEKKKVFEDFPTPLVNRLEKHFINNETLLEDWQIIVVSDIEKWLNNFMNEAQGYECIFKL